MISFHADLSQMCNMREKAHLQKNYTPKGDPETIFGGAYYLVEVDDMFQRKYEIKS